MRRHARIGLLFLVACAAEGPDQKDVHMVKPPEMLMFKSPEETRAFAEKIGLDDLPQQASGRGVVASWDHLPGHLSPLMSGMEVDATSPRVVFPGLATREWTWSGSDDELSVRVYVGSSSQPVRAQLLQLATMNMMRTIPYDLGPNGLGDLAIRDDPTSPESVIWVFSNVCVHITSDGSAFPAETIALAVQSFLESRIVDDLPKHIPSIVARASSLNISVGETVEVQVVVSSPEPAHRLAPHVLEQKPQLLSRVGSSGISFTFEASQPGTSQLGIHVADSRTLLSPDTWVELQVRQP